MRTSHPLFYNQLYARVEPAGLAAEWAAAATNTNVHTFEVAPVYTLLENEVIKKMSSLVGFEDSEADGLFVPGGSASNLYAMHLARHKAFPETRRGGLAALARPLAAFTSEQSHYSYTKAAALTGLGTDNMVAVACDEYGAMRPEALEAAIDAAEARGQVRAREEEELKSSSGWRRGQGCMQSRPAVAGHTAVNPAPSSCPPPQPPGALLRGPDRGHHRDWRV
jgi:glutamate/tyrosine decarboxylase-like PLP-dependent enzyme